MEKSKGRHAPKESATSTALKMLREMADNDLRICQIMSNLFDGIAKDGKDPFYVEDAELVEYIIKYKG